MYSLSSKKKWGEGRAPRTDILQGQPWHRIVKEAVEDESQLTTKRKKAHEWKRPHGRHKKDMNKGRTLSSTMMSVT